MLTNVATICGVQKLYTGTSPEITHFEKLLNAPNYYFGEHGQN